MSHPHRTIAIPNCLVARHNLTQSLPSSLASVQFLLSRPHPHTSSCELGNWALPSNGGLGDQRPCTLSRFGRRGIVLLTLGLVGPCGVGGAAAGSSTGVMALRFLLGFLLAGVDLGVYLMREWHPPKRSFPWGSPLPVYNPGHSHCPLESPQSLLQPQISAVRTLSCLFAQAFEGSRGLSSIHTHLLPLSLRFPCPRFITVR